MPDKLGPFRSVQPASVRDRKVLLVGTRNGVLVVDRDQPMQNVEAYPDPELKSELGFNRVALWNENTGFWASHADGGLVAWGIGNEIGPHEKLATMVAMAVTGTASAPQNLQILDGQYAVFSVGNEVIATDTEDRYPLAIESNASVVSIVLSPSEFFAVHEDGLIVHYDRANAPTDRPRESRRPNQRGLCIAVAGFGPFAAGT